MSEEQLTALLAKLKQDAGLQEKFKGAADLEAAVAIAKEAGFDVCQADWLKHQAQQMNQLSDSELESVAGGAKSNDCKSAETLKNGFDQCCFSNVAILCP